MYFLWVCCHGRGKGYYLPEEKNWSGRLEVPSRLLDNGQPIEIPVFVSNNVYSIAPPTGFFWAGNKHAHEEHTLVHCNRETMQRDELKIDIYVAELDKTETAMRKYELGDREICIGSNQKNDIRYMEKGVSREHAVLYQADDGKWMLDEKSSLGTFVNDRYVCGEQVELLPGDNLLILPCLRILFLGGCIAISAVKNMSVGSAISPLIAYEHYGNQEQEPDVFKNYHRAPRHIQQANCGVFEIDAPIERNNRNDLPAWLTIGPSFTMIVPMLVSSMVTGGNVVSSLAMMGTSSMLAVMWATFNRSYQNKQATIAETKRVETCKKYYAEMEERLQAETERERKRLENNYLSVRECIALPASRNHRLWERMPQHDDFLMIRLGKGETELPSQIQVKQPSISMTEDPLRQEPIRLRDQYEKMQDVPILFDFKKNQMVGVLGFADDPWLLQSMVVQACAHHSYHDVKVIILHDEREEEKWAFAKWLPHVYADDDHNFRMVGSNKTAIDEILRHLDNELAIRSDAQAEENKTKASEDKADEKQPIVLPWFLIFCTSPSIIEGQPITRFFTRRGLGFSVIIQTRSMEMLPKECQTIIDAREKLGAVYNMTGNMMGVLYENAEDRMLKQFSNEIATMRILDSMDNAVIPSVVTFLQSYNARSVEDLDIGYYWNENHAYESIKSLLGFKSGSIPFILDISDKNHGPHGLIAGTTGAGKSVLLQSFILSLAINYSPTEVQFILIDYKGGGTSEDFRSLPHAAGIIDSLQGERMIFRALASIKGEILRREQMFKDAGVNNIDDYMRFFNKDETKKPLGHLIIIVDEFAELAKEQPDFLHELVSAARVGRSLGMHLVLATQKPANSVTDEIEANTRFRICLRVASRSDSQDMLKRPEAAYLKGMGRCYVQVGNDELFEQVQTSYSGAHYDPNAPRMEEQPRILNDVAQPIRIKKKKVKRKVHPGWKRFRKMIRVTRKKLKKDKREKTELVAVLKHINDSVARYHFSPAKPLWLKEISPIVMLENLEPVKNCRFKDGKWPQKQDEDLRGYFCLADNIAKQQYVPTAVEFTRDNNYIILGQSGKGKTTLLQTLAVSLALRYSPDEVNIYIFSLTSMMLSCLSGFPHVGEIVFEDEVDEQIRLMEMIAEECERRKKAFANMATDNYVQYNRAVRSAGHPEQAVPAIVVMIDRMQQIRDWENSRTTEDKLMLFYNLLRSANSQGVYFVLTAFERNELQGKYQPYVHGVALQMNDRSDYADALNTRIPSDWGGINSNPGRGLVSYEDKAAKQTFIYEIQTAVYGSAKSDASRADAVKALGREMRSAWTGKKPKGILRVPKEPTISGLIRDAEQELAVCDQLPVCYQKLTGMIGCLNLRDAFTFLIFGPSKSGKTTALKSIAKMFQQKGGQVYCVGSESLVEWCGKQDVQAYGYDNTAWDDTLSGTIFGEIGRRSGLLSEAHNNGGEALQMKVREQFKPLVILIDDLDQFVKTAGEEREQMLQYLAYTCADNVWKYRVYLYATISQNGFNGMRYNQPEMLRSMLERGQGMLLRSKLSDFDPFDLSVEYAMKSIALPVGECFICHDGEAEIGVLPMEDEE